MADKSFEAPPPNYQYPSQTQPGMAPGPPPMNMQMPAQQPMGPSAAQIGEEYRAQCTLDYSVLYFVLTYTVTFSVRQVCTGNTSTRDNIWYLRYYHRSCLLPHRFHLSIVCITTLVTRSHCNSPS